LAESDIIGVFQNCVVMIGMLSIRHGLMLNRVHLNPSDKLMNAVICCRLMNWHQHVSVSRYRNSMIVFWLCSIFNRDTEISKYMYYSNNLFIRISLSKSCQTSCDGWQWASEAQQHDERSVRRLVSLTSSSSPLGESFSMRSFRRFATAVNSSAIW
jgi:hypothetical protein